MKQSVNINFSQGINNKVDPWQLPLGQFESLTNSVFQKGGLLQKRPGYPTLVESTPPTSLLTTLNGNLVSVGPSLSSYSPTLDTWVDKGQLQPCGVSVLPTVRNTLNQVQADSVVDRGLVLTAYTSSYGQGSGQTTTYSYVVSDATTGQNVVEPTLIPAIATGTVSGSPRVFLIGPFFVVVVPVLVSGTTFLQYVAVPTQNPLSPLDPQEVTSQAYVPITGNPGWDAVAVNEGGGAFLAVAYNTTTGGQGVHVASLLQTQIAAGQSTSTIHAYTGSTNIAALMTVAADVSTVVPTIYVSFWNNTNTDGYTIAYTTSGSFQTPVPLFGPVQSITTTAVVNLASVEVVNQGGCVLLWEVANTYGYDPSVSTNYIEGVPVFYAGVVGSAQIAVRSVGLASKAVQVGGVNYVLAAYNNPTTTINPPVNVQSFQPSYFLINISESVETAPTVVAKLAYQNGGGLLSLGLPSLTFNGVALQTAYRFKDLVTGLNTVNNPQLTTSGGVYSQTGVNLATFDLTTTPVTAEIASNLHISGGFLSQFDGFSPVEHNFFVFPDTVETSYASNSVVTPTGTASSGSVSVVVSSAADVYPGMTILDTTNSGYITAGTVVVFVNGTILTISQPTTHSFSGDTLHIQSNVAAQPDGSTNTNAYFYIATYEWTDNQGLPYRSGTSVPVAVTTSGSGTTGIINVFVPTLRLTYKISVPVKIVVYRWSVAQQVYQQVTSINSPLLNNLAVDYVTFVDTQSDVDIQGNNILYTTGGQPSDVNAPATSIMALFNQSLCVVPSESPNTLWIGQTVLPGTPVEMSTSFQINVAPTQGTEGSLGPVTALYPMDDKLIIFFANGIYYINGTPPPATGATSTGCSLGGYSQPVFITNSVGCTNQQSLVLIPDGLMFQSNKGTYLLPRNLATPPYIGDRVENFNQFAVNSAAVVPNTNYVLLTLTGTNQFLMYDWYFQQWGVFQGVSAMSACIYQGLHTVLDIYGDTLQATPGVYSDYDTPVCMSFTTSWINLANLQGYQRARDFYLLARYLTPHTLLCSVAYDYNPGTLSSTTITPKNTITPLPSPFGVPTPFGASSDKEQWRVHFKQQLCESFQLSVQEQFDPSKGLPAGAGFTMSGITAWVEVKRGGRPIAGAVTSGMAP